MDQFKSGFAAIIGRPNVGKSTMMNMMIGEKVAIVSDKPQTTRNIIQCVLTRPGHQIVFIDTPGIHKPKNRLGQYMVKTANNTLNEVDIVIFVVDIAAGIGGGDRYIMDILESIDTPVVLVANKADAVPTETARDAVKQFDQTGIFTEVITASGLKGTNLDKLEEVIVKHLPFGPKYYPDDMITDQPERVIIAELVREKALEFLKEEIPHGIGVEIMEIKERKDKEIVDIHATIYCEKNSHKSIVIGKNGKMLQDIGRNARIDIENLLGIRVNLQTWVKVKDDWRNNINDLRNLGYE